MWADMKCLGDLWTGAVRSKIPSKWQAILACLKRSMEQRKSGRPQWQDWVQKLPVSLASSASALLLAGMLISSLQWGHFWGPQKHGRGRTACEDLKERPQLAVQLSGGVGSEVSYSQRNIWSIWGGVSLNPKDWVNNTPSNEASIQV